MQYRAEIDGLRAVAVTPVVLFHAGLPGVGGGFVGVDVFFVISGYLITSIILAELSSDTFSVVEFYERRARRILPALFLVMAATTILAYLWMLPDELENFGQSLVATSLFSNNILLLLTSGYWDLASEFKPLLHTWSLAVEEQYYVVIPLLLMCGWRWFRSRLKWVLLAIAVASLLAAQWGTVRWPAAAFYLLPTRAWELMIGSMAAFRPATGDVSPRLADGLSAAGLAAIVTAVVAFSKATPTPSVVTLVPTIGAVMILLWAHPGTVVHKLLSARPTVAVGLVSYSAYLWHFPVFALARIHAIEPFGQATAIGLCLVTLALACLTWRFVERPFRDRAKVSRSMIFAGSLLTTIAFAGLGLYLHASHGVPARIFADQEAGGGDMYIDYNERAFAYKKPAFERSDALHVLVVGNSFGRDFVNMILESFDTRAIELVYRDDLPECLETADTPLARRLLDGAGVVVLASGGASRSCVTSNVATFEARGKKLFYAGTKHFGYNLNWLARLSREERRNQLNPLLQETIGKEGWIASIVPPANYISLIAPIRTGNSIAVTDDEGRLISPDRTHLTRQGAIYLGRRALIETPFGRALQAGR